MKDLLTGALLVVGAAFMLLSAVGLLRMPDLFTRMHASTKTPALAVVSLLAAVALHFAETAVTTRALLAVVFFFLTVPVSAHMIGRAAYVVGVKLWEGTIVDELEERHGFADEPRTKEGSRLPPHL